MALLAQCLAVLKSPGRLKIVSVVHVMPLVEGHDLLDAKLVTVGIGHGRMGSKNKPLLALAQRDPRRAGSLARYFQT